MRPIELIEKCAAALPGEGRNLPGLVARQKIDAVIANGKLLDRAALDQLLTDVAKAAHQQK